MTWTRLMSAQHRARAKLLMKKAQPAPQPHRDRMLHFAEVHIHLAMLRDKEEAASASSYGADSALSCAGSNSLFNLGCGLHASMP